MPTVRLGDIDFHYREAGTGIPVIFQHGLGGDVNQPFGLLIPPSGFRLLAFDCRGHGETRPVGDETKYSISRFADDLLAMMDAWGLSQAIIGGISMGAAIALNFVLRFPDRAIGLILSRPAWLEGPMQANARIYATIAQLIRQHGAVAGCEIFQQSETYREKYRQSPDCAASLLGQFRHPRAEETVVKLERIPVDCPIRKLDELQSINVPTLVLANRQDPIHPFEYGETLARFIRGAEFHELTPKSVSSAAHASDVQRWIHDFLQRRFGT